MCEIQRIVGFNKKIRGGLAFSEKSTLFYISGQTGIYHSLENNVESFLPIMEKNEFTAMSLSENNLLAIASKGFAPKLAVYNLKSNDTFVLPNSDKRSITEYVSLAFSDDEEYVAAQGSVPGWPFLRWHLKEKYLVGVYFPFRLEIGAKVLKFSFNPKDSNNVVSIGRFFFRIYHFENENSFKEDVWRRYERSRKTFHCLTWLQKTEKFAVGTSEGTVLIFENKKLVQKIYLDEKLAEVPRILNKIANLEDKNINCILSTKAGIICSYGGNSVLCLHWTTNNKDFSVVSSVHMEEADCFDKDSKIVQLALNSNEDRLAAATDNGHILTFFFKFPGLLEIIGYFDVILSQQHTAPVICTDSAVNSPIHVTCSEKTLILWNYQKMQLSFWKKFDDDICSVSIDPLGINLLIGFRKNCKVYNILNDKMEEVQEFESQHYKQVKFSKGGHMLALANKDFTEVYSNLSFEKIAQFDNENKIKCLLWKNNDHHLLLLDKVGNMYEFNVVQRTKVWSFSSNCERISTIAIYKTCIYAGTSAKILVFDNYTKTDEIETDAKVTSILPTEHMLLVGCENGAVCGFKLPFGKDKLFETCCHKGSIIDMIIKENGKLLLVTGEDCAISMWKMNYEMEDSIPVFNEILIEQELYDSNIKINLQLEKELQEKRIAAERKITEQLNSQQKDRKELEEYYEDIENQLKQTLTVLSEEKHNLKIDIKNRKLKEIEALCKERDEHFAEFQTKIEKEKDNFDKLKEERLTKVKECELQLFNIKEKIKTSNEKFQRIKKGNEMRLEELQFMLQKELDARQELTKENEKIYRNIEEKEKALSEEANFKFISDLKKIRTENELLTVEAERLTAVMNYEKESLRTLNAEFEEKKSKYDGLERIINQIKNRICETKIDMQRKESMTEERIAMIKLLEEESKETKHMNSEANWRLDECKKKLNQKSEELAQLSSESEKLETERQNLKRKLEQLQRKRFLMDEKLKDTEKSIFNSNQKLLKTQMLLEHYREEFIDATKDTESPFVLRTAILKLLDKNVLRKGVKEEVFEGDMDPFLKFCRQRNHYESLINTVLNRTQEIQASARNTYVNLAKENSDWTAFAEALRYDVKQKKNKIETLERCVKLRAEDFLKDPFETQRRFSREYERLKQIEMEEDEEVKKRIDIIEKQTTELQRLHGIIVVEERGKIIRKIDT